jgi:hypothetical protein
MKEILSFYFITSINYPSNCCNFKSVYKKGKREGRGKKYVANDHASLLNNCAVTHPPPFQAIY